MTAPHRYEHTRATLDLFLPRMRPGGLYVIEDWTGHWPGEQWQDASNQFAKERNPLTKLIFELVMTAETDPGLISQVDLTDKCAFITRGADPVLQHGLRHLDHLSHGRRKLLHRPAVSFDLPNRYEVRRWLRRHDPAGVGRERTLNGADVVAPVEPGRHGVGRIDPLPFFPMEGDGDVVSGAARSTALNA